MATLDEMEADVACVTETWVSHHHTNIVDDLSNRSGYSIITKNRTSGKGGGVCIVYNRSQITMIPCKLPESEFEVVAAVGRRTGQRRKVLVISAYIPPNASAETNKSFLSYVCDVILAQKAKYNDPYVILAGDFNRRDVNQATRDFPDMKIVKTPPTRGRATLDIISTNLIAGLKDAGVTAPIQSVDGVPSDHKTVYATFHMPRVPQYKIVKYSYIRKNEESLAKFDSWLTEQDWKSVITPDDPTEKVRALHELLRTGQSSVLKKRKVSVRLRSRLGSHKRSEQ